MISHLQSSSKVLDDSILKWNSKPILNLNILLYFFGPLINFSHEYFSFRDSGPHSGYFSQVFIPPSHVSFWGLTLIFLCLQCVQKIWFCLKSCKLHACGWSKSLVSAFLCENSIGVIQCCQHHYLLGLSFSCLIFERKYFQVCLHFVIACTSINGRLWLFFLNNLLNLWFNW